MKRSRPKTVLVTGNAGFIGSHLTEKLLADNYRVIGGDNFNDFYDPKVKEKNVAAAKKNPRFKQYRTDITDFGALERIFEEREIDLVVHLAARAGVRPSLVYPRLYQKVNVEGTVNLLELTRKFEVGRFIFGSSSSVYGEQKKVPFSETDPVNRPVSPYAASKKSAEMFCFAYSKLFGIKTTVLRFFTVYGPRGRPDMAPYIFAKAILKGEPITRYGKGDTSRDYTYVDDVVTGILAAVKKPFDYEVINLGHNRPVTLNQFIATIEKIAGKKAKIFEQPRHPADVSQTFADIGKAKKLLAWQPKTDLETGLRRFLNWYSNSQP